jgi:hypothetical protein
MSLRRPRNKMIYLQTGSSFRQDSDYRFHYKIYLQTGSSFRQDSDYRFHYKIYLQTGSSFRQDSDYRFHYKIAHEGSGTNHYDLLLFLRDN